MINQTGFIFLAYMLAGVLVAVITHLLRPTLPPSWLSAPAAMLAVAVRLCEGLVLAISTGHHGLDDFRLDRLVLWFTAIALMYLTLWRLKAHQVLHASAAPAIQPLVDVSESLLASAQTYAATDTPHE